MIDKGNIIAKSTKAELVSQSSILPTTVQIETSNGEFSTELEGRVILREGNLFTLKLDNSDQLLPILNLLKLANVKINDIRINHPSLEDVFINYLHR